MKKIENYIYYLLILSSYFAVITSIVYLGTGVFLKSSLFALTGIGWSLVAMNLFVFGKIK